METLNAIYQWLAAAPVFIQIPVGLALFWLLAMAVKLYAYLNDYKSPHRS